MTDQPVPLDDHLTPENLEPTLQQLEAKGLKTYAQVAKTKDGDRIRVRLGPFADRAAADKAAAQAKAVGLAGAVLTL